MGGRGGKAGEVFQASQAQLEQHIALWFQSSRVRRAVDEEGRGGGGSGPIQEWAWSAIQVGARQQEVETEKVSR